MTRWCVGPAVRLRELADDARIVVHENDRAGLLKLENAFEPDQPSQPLVHATSTPRTLANICANAVIGSQAMDRPLPKPSQMDGKLTYRVDMAGQSVALLPARCKLGRHTLGRSQFRAVVSDGEARISCLACATDTADHFWRLTATAPAPDRAELSEELYFDLVRSRSRTALSSTGGHRA